jgi:hypothetical protein
MNNSIVFVYYKEDKIKVLTLEQSKDKHEQIISEGWIHTATLDSCVYIEHLFNNNEDALYLTIKQLSQIKPIDTKKEYDKIYKRVFEKAKSICNSNRHLLEQSEYIETLKTWTIDILASGINYYKSK